MTREEAINILARLAGGATQSSWKEIRDAARFAIDILSNKQEPQGLDEVAEEYLKEYYAKIFQLTYDDLTSKSGSGIIEAFKAGAEWMAERGVGLTWKDVQMLNFYCMECQNEEREDKNRGKYPNVEAFFKEVLKRFNENKKK